MADQLPEFDITNETGGPNDAPVSIEDGQNNTGLKARVETKADGSNAVHVITGDSASTDKKVVYGLEFLIDGGSKDMNVNGSGTPVVFTAGPPAGQIWFVDELNVFIQDGGNLNPNNYGSLGSLSNGTLIETTVDSTDYEYFNMTNNLEIINSFPAANFLGASNGFLNSNKNYFGATVFKPKVTLTGDNGDLFKTTIRDNLNGLDFHQMAIRYHRIV